MKECNVLHYKKNLLFHCLLCSVNNKINSKVMHFSGFVMIFFSNSKCPQYQKQKPLLKKKFCSPFVEFYRKCNGSLQRNIYIRYHWTMFIFPKKIFECFYLLLEFLYKRRLLLVVCLRFQQFLPHFRRVIPARLDIRNIRIYHRLLKYLSYKTYLN